MNAQPNQAAETGQRINPEYLRLRDALAGSLQQSLIANLLGAFPDDHQLWERIAEREGKNILKATNYIANRVMHEITREGLLPVERTLPKGSGYLLAVMEG